jgi:hypothetical protein
VFSNLQLGSIEFDGCVILLTPKRSIDKSQPFEFRWPVPALLASDDRWSSLKAQTGRNDRRAMLRRNRASV